MIASPAPTRGATIRDGECYDSEKMVVGEVAATLLAGDEAKHKLAPDKPQIVSQSAEEPVSPATANTLNQTERHRVQSICQSLLLALKLDHRCVNPSRFLSELKCNQVYNELYLALDQQCKKPDSKWISIMLAELVKQVDSPISTRVALLKGVSDGLTWGIVTDYEEVADCLLRYHTFFIEASSVVLADVSNDEDMEVMPARLHRKRSGHGALGSDDSSTDVPLWFHIVDNVVRSKRLSPDTVMDLWKACSKNLELGRPWMQSLSLIAMNTMAFVAPHVDMVLHLCSFLLNDTECSHCPEFLSLLSSLLDAVTSVDSLVAKAITFHALKYRHQLHHCLLTMNRVLHRLPKLEFEMFLQVVVLRVLREGRDDERESCLYFISDICMPPTLFLNFDADFPAPNLWESLLKELGNIACPEEEALENETGDRPEDPLSREAHERRVASTVSARQIGGFTAKSSSNHLNSLAYDIILRILRVFGDDFLSFPDEFSFSEAVARTPHELLVRKKQKLLMQSVSSAFNSSESEKGSFLKIAVEGELIETEDDAKGLARFFHDCDDLDKRMLGEYLSQGPAPDYPFHARVRQEYAGQLSFEGLTFAESLRKFLSNFRLPGEAQCIDRLMEVFSEELYKQQGHSSVFRNADAVYVLSFSTIMLQTDLHNPTIKSELRMTKDQFIRNNRGINGGEDLPEDFIGDLYDKIKGRKLDVRNQLHDFDVSSCTEFEVAWDETMSRPCKPPVQLCGQSSLQLSIAMFETLTRTALSPILQVFVRSKDSSVVVEAIRALDTVVMVSKTHELYSVFDEILEVLLPISKDYILSCIASTPLGSTDDRIEESTCMDSTCNSLVPHEEALASEEIQEETVLEALLLTIPKAKAGENYHLCIDTRGIIAVDRSFSLLGQYPSEVAGGTFLSFIDCLCALRDIRALPRGMSNLDDFADSKGNVLPLSSFARNSQKKLDDYNRATYGKDTVKSKGWFRSFFRKGRLDENIDNAHDDAVVVAKDDLSSQAKTLLEISVAVEVESVVQRRTSNNHDQTIDQLLGPLDRYPFENDPTGEQNAVFSLELAARALLSYSGRSEQSFLPFLSKFESILCKIAADDEEIPSPFVIERIVVTILRSCIHLYSFDEVSLQKPTPALVLTNFHIQQLRPHLRASLQLLMMTLPRSFIRATCDRIACGLAIILRSSFHCFGQQEWSFMGDTLDTLANFGPSRVFVFDGIASTVEYSLPEELLRGKEDVGRPQLALDACNALSKILTRFVLGFYQNDTSLTIPAMLCLEKVYKRKSTIRADREPGSQMIPDVESWQHVAVAMYSACRSPDEETSREGLECFRRNILNSAAVQDIPSEKWIVIFYLVANKQPPLSSETSRGNTFALFGQLITIVASSLSHLEEHREDLEDIVGLYAGIAEENLRQSSRGLLFKSTLQTLSYVSNHLVSTEWTGDKAFGCWASELLFQGLQGANLDNTPKTTANAREEEDVSEISDSAAESELDE